MAATFLEQLLKGAQIHSRPFGNNIVRARFGRMDLKRSRAGHLASYRCDRNQRVVTSTHVGVVCDELLIDHDGVEFDSQPATAWHPFAAVAGQIDEESLDTVSLHVHVEGR